MTTDTSQDGRGATGAAGGTRREFVLGVLGGLSAAALLDACDGDGGGGRDALAGTADGGRDAAAGAPETSGADLGGADLGAGGDADAAPGAPDAPAAPDGGAPDAGGPGPDAAAPDGGGADAGATCTVYPEQTAGPFYLDLDLLRRDVTEEKPGTPLRLVMRVLKADGCTALQGLAVDIWHCDAAGVYSGYPGQLGGLDTTGQRFLRGTQITGDDGTVQFDTIYPGWYPGRTTHIHFRVHLSATMHATSQLYFPEDVNHAVYQTDPYRSRGQKDTNNTADGVVRASGLPPLLALRPVGGGYEGQLTVTVAD